MKKKTQQCEKKTKIEIEKNRMILNFIICTMNKKWNISSELELSEN